MLKTETLLICEWYDGESIRELSVSCECGLIIPSDVLDRCVELGVEYPCPCGRIVRLAELDKLADSLSWRITQVSNVDK